MTGTWQALSGYVLSSNLCFSLSLAVKAGFASVLPYVTLKAGCQSPKARRAPGNLMSMCLNTRPHSLTGVLACAGHVAAFQSHFVPLFLIPGPCHRAVSHRIQVKKPREGELSETPGDLPRSSGTKTLLLAIE